MAQQTTIAKRPGKAAEPTQPAQPTHPAPSSHHDPLALKLDALHATLEQIDRSLGGGGHPVPFLADLMRIGDELADLVDQVGPDARVHLTEIVGWVRAFPGEVEARLARLGPSKEIASEPVLGVLPLARAVPQDLHSALDSVHAGGALVSGLMADSLSGKLAGAALGGSGVTVSLLTDYRLSAAKVIPIEAHEVIDHAWGLAAIAAPFALGYWKKDPAVAATHVLLGATTILVSLFTDYRAANGVGRDPVPQVST
ncbi:MAG: hypothetical protein NVS3B10_07030 [Polyangiales bacterium]